MKFGLDGIAGIKSGIGRVVSDRFRSSEKANRATR